MFNRYLATAIVAVCMLAASPVRLAYADEASHRQAAEELLVVSESDKNFEKGFLVGYNATVKDLPPEMQKAGLAFGAKYLTWDAIKEDVIKLHMENFTEEELKDITAFYRTATGKKSISLMPVLLAKNVEIVQQKLAEHRDELIENMTAAKKEVDARMAREAQEKPQPDAPPLK